MVYIFSLILLFSLILTIIIIKNNDEFGGFLYGDLIFLMSYSLFFGDKNDNQLIKLLIIISIIQIIQIYFKIITIKENLKRKEYVKKLKIEKERKKEKRNNQNCLICNKSLLNDNGNLDNLICENCENLIYQIDNNLKSDFFIKLEDFNYNNLTIDLSFLTNENKNVLKQINYKEYSFYNFFNKKLDIKNVNNFLKYRKEFFKDKKQFEKEKLEEKKRQQKRKEFPVCKYCNKALPLDNYYMIDTIKNKDWLYYYINNNNDEYKAPCKECKRKYKNHIVKNKKTNSNNNNNNLKTLKNNNYYVYYIKIFNPYNPYTQFKIGYTLSIEDNIIKSINNRYQGCLDRIKLSYYYLCYSKLEAKKLEAKIINENIKYLLKDKKKKNLSHISEEEVFEFDIFNNNNYSFIKFQNNN